MNTSKIIYAKGLKCFLKKRTGKNFDEMQQLLGFLRDTLPHAQFSKWKRKSSDEEAGANLKGGSDNKQINIRVRFDDAWLLMATLTKGRAFGVYERQYINVAVQQISLTIKSLSNAASTLFVSDVSRIYDLITSEFLKILTKIPQVNYLEILNFYKDLAQQSYESNAISYGIIVTEKLARKKKAAIFPKDIMGEKRFQSITDGYSTVLYIDSIGKIVRLAGLKQKKETREREHFCPLWLMPLASMCDHDRELGIALSRNGAILITWRGNLIMSNRASKWTLWNHDENVEIIKENLAAQGTKPKDLGRMAARLYRVALDIAFKRSGGLFVVLRTRGNISQLVSYPEQLLGKRRTKGDLALGEWLHEKTIVGIERETLSDLAALDGAVVCARNGKILAYGSVLKIPRKTGLGKIEGSRSRAAHSASYFGLSIKISSDGEIKVSRRGKACLIV
ncbi:MAG: hypothetical protein WC133_00440 [Candidatus Omnitrophota bacterium]